MSAAGAWWDVFASSGGLAELETWLGGVDAPTRVRVRERIGECGYQSVLDVGAGLGLDYVGMRNLSHPVTYQGVEPSATMRKAAQQLASGYGLGEEIPIVIGSSDALPFADSSFDLVYCRHVFEHLPSFEPALAEMVRVAHLEVIVVFFMRPGAETYLLRERDGLWQNRWSKTSVEDALANNAKIEVWFWEHVGSEALLHAYLVDAVAVDADAVAARLKAGA